MNAGSPARFGLGRQARIRRGRDFMSLRQVGQRISQGTLLMNWQVVPGRVSRRLGVITSRRIGGAVVRNRARRLIREAFRAHQHRLVPGVEMVLVARPSIGGKPYAVVEKDFLSAVRKTGLWCTQHPAE